MTATTTLDARLVDPFALPLPGGIVAALDLWFPTQQDPVGPEQGANWGAGPDPLRYVVWVDAGRWHGNGREGQLGNFASLPELAPRHALHVGLRPSLGVHDCDGCRP